MPGRKVRALKVSIEGGDLVLIKDTERDRVPVSSIRRVGTMRRYSRVLVALVIVMAAISMYTQDLLHTLLTLIMLGVALATKEEVLVLETVDGSTVEVSARDRRSLKKVLEELKGVLTR